MCFWSGDFFNNKMKITIMSRHDIELPRTELDKHVIISITSTKDSNIEPAAVSTNAHTLGVLFLTFDDTDGGPHQTGVKMRRNF